MKKVLILASVLEAMTGVGLLFVPSPVAQLLLGEPLSGAAVPVARVAGIAMASLAIACWPGPPAAGMLAYSGAVALYLAWLAWPGIASSLSGILLWPAVVLHLVLAALLAWTWIRRPQNGSGRL